MSANAVGVLDPHDGEIAAEIPVGSAPGGVAAGTDSIWVTNTGEGTVSRIDPATQQVQQTVDVGGGPFGVAVTPNAAWVANGLDATVSRIDTRSTRVSQTIDVGNGPTGAAAGAGAVWVTNSTDGTVSRIDPATGRVTKTLPAAPGASAIAVGFGRIWVVSPPSAKVVAIDPDSGRIVDEIGVGVDPSAVAIGSDAVWVANRADGTVSKIEPRTGAVIGTTGVGRSPTGLAAGPDTVWVANAGDGTLSEVDSSRVTVVKSVLLGNPPKDVVWTPRGAYVTVGSSGAEHRGGNLTVSASAPDFIDPALAYTVSSWATLVVTNDGLVAFRKVGGVQGTQLVPDLATALPILTDGGRTYTFQVRLGIRYSNGKLVQPADFRRAIERLFELGSPGAVYYSGIVGVDRCRKGSRCDLSRGVVTDRAARTITFRLAAPDGDFLTKLALPFAFAVPVSTPTRMPATRPVPATGPYRIAEYRTKTRKLRLVRNPLFREWSADAQPQGFPDSLTISWPGVPRASLLRVQAVRRGDADIAILGGGPPLPADEAEQLAAQYPSQLRFSTAFNTEYFFLSTRVEPFDDIRVRRAVSTAFDSDAFAKSEGIQVAPTCRILPPNFPGYEPTCLYASGGVQGIDRARREIKRAGVAGTHVTVWTLGPVRERGRYMASLLRSIGFRADVKIVVVGRFLVLHHGQRSPKPGPDRLRGLGGRLPVRRRLPAAARRLRGVHAQKPGAEHQPGRVLQSLDRRKDGEGGCASGHEPTRRDAALAADRARRPRPGADSADRQPPQRRLRLRPRRELPLQPAMGSAPQSALGRTVTEGGISPGPYRDGGACPISSGAPGRSGRVAEGGALLRRYGGECLHRGFESLLLRRSRLHDRRTPSATLTRPGRGAGAVERGGLENR